MHIEELIREYKSLLAEQKGQEAASQVQVRWTGGSSVVIEESGKRRLLDLETFRVIVANLRKEALPKAA